MMKQYNQYKNNLVNFLSMNLEEMEDMSLLKLLSNFKRQLRECGDENMEEVISTGIDLIETMLDSKIDIIAVNKVKMNKAFKDWKRRKGYTNEQ